MCVRWRENLHRMKSNVDGLQHMWWDDADLLEWHIVGMARNEPMAMMNQPWLGIWNQQQLLGCKYEEVDLASCIHGYVHRKPNRHHSGVVMVHRKHISSKWLNILRYLDRYRKHIHILVMRLGLGRISLFHSLQPNCNCSDCVRHPFHRTTNHFRMFPMSMYRLYTRRIGHNCLDEHRPVRRRALDNVELKRHGPESQMNKSTQL